jgi:hypothetical protein
MTLSKGLSGQTAAHTRDTGTTRIAVTSSGSTPADVQGSKLQRAGLDETRRLTRLAQIIPLPGGNPDPSSTHGKKPKEAKALELQGWPYPRDLAGRHFGVVTHGDSVGAETLRRSLVDWLTDLSLISAGGMAETDGYIGYMEPYATSHQALDKNKACQEEVLNVARARQCRAAASRRKG